MRIRKAKTPVIALFLATFLCIEGAAPTMVQVVGAENVQQEATSAEEQMISTALTYIKGENAYILDGSILSGAGSTGSDWFAFGCGRYGIEDNYAAYLTQLENYVTACYGANPTYGLNRNKATEWHRITFAVLSCGGDPTSFGTKPDGSKVNLIADGVYNCIIGNPWKQGINGAIFGLLALDTKKYEVPEGALYTRDQLISYILGKELAMGGFALSGAAADPDITAMALQALAPYYNTRTDVKESVDRALSVLSSLQREDGGYASWGTVNAESAAQVIVALCALGIDVNTDERFISSSGKTVLDGLEQFYDESTGAFRHTLDGSTDGMATQQAVYGLVAYLRFCKEDTALYDYTEKTDTSNPETPTPTPTPETPNPETPTPTPETPSTETPNTEDNTKAIEQLDSDIWNQIDPLRITQSDSTTIEALMKRYQRLSAQDKEKVANASSLMEAYEVIQAFNKQTIPQRVFQNIAQTQETFVYQGKVKNYDYTYTISGKKLKAKNSMNAAISLQTQDMEQLKAPTFSFYSKQTTAFNTTVTLKLKTNLSKGTYQAYRYNTKKKELQILSEAVRVDKDGYVTLQITSGGEYYISKGIESNQDSGTDKNEKPTAGNGADTTNGSAVSTQVTSTQTAASVAAKTVSGQQTSTNTTTEGHDKLITKSDIEAIMGTDETIRVESKTQQGTWYAMTLAGAGITEASDVSVELTNGSQYESEILQLADQPYIFSLAQKGEFPGDVLVELATDLTDGDYVLFSYNVEKMCAEAVQLVEVANQTTKFIVSEGGEYFIAEKAKAGSLEASTETAAAMQKENLADTEVAEVGATTKTESADEADQEFKSNSVQTVAVIILVLIVLAAGGYYVKTKRK